MSLYIFSSNTTRASTATHSPSRSTIKVQSGGSRTLRIDIEDVPREFSVVPDVPLTVDLLGGFGLGIAGPSAAANGLARFVVAQAAALQSPAELVICAALGKDQQEDWEWLRWLPHVQGSTLPVYPLATDQHHILELLEALRSRAESGQDDTTGDGRVTLNEIYQHTYAETLARTEDTLGGPQHPNYDIRLTGAGDLVLTDLSNPSAALVLDEDLRGRVSLRDGSGRLVAEVNKRLDEPLTMALPPGNYDLSVQMDNNRYTGDVVLQRGGSQTVGTASLTRIRPEYTQFRGGDVPEPETVGFSIGMAPGLNFPEVDDSIVNFQIGLPVASVWAVEGVQMGLILSTAEAGVDGWQAAVIGTDSSGPLSGAQTSAIYARAGGAVTGAQISGIFNNTTNLVKGAQITGIFNNATGTLQGTQIAGIFNRSTSSIAGVQVAGIFNLSRGRMDGVQLSGIYNQASEVRGAQIGLVNVSQKSSGVLVGLVNYSDDMRAFPIGLVNISRSGIKDLDFRWEQGGRYYVSLKTGNRYYYTRFIMGFSDWDLVNNPDAMVFGFGAGFRLTMRPFYLEFDLDWKTALEDYSMYSSAEESWNNFLAVPTISVTAGLGRRFGVYAGFGLSLKTPWVNRESVLLDSGYDLNLSSDGKWSGVIKFYTGFHF